MSSWITYAVVLGIAVIGRWAYYAERVWFLQRLEKEWGEYLMNPDMPYQVLAEKKSRIKELLRDAGLHEYKIPVTVPTGYSFVQHGEFSVWENFLTRSTEIATQFRPMLFEAIGYYKRRRNESINPFYWIALVVFLPRHVLEYLGIKGDALATRILQVIYWFLGILAVVFREIILQLIRSWLAIS